ncbi:MAG: DMT family transporter [Methyloligellaceae bacterium]
MFLRFTAVLFANAHILLCLTTLFWAGNFVLARGVSGHFPPIALAWFRWTLAFMIILPFTIGQVRKDWPIIKKHIPVLITLGVLGVGSFNTLSYIGLTHTTAINALILQSSGPILIAILAFLIFRDKVTRLQMIGILTSLIGVSIVILKADIQTLAQLTFNVGDIWVFAAMVCWAVYTVFLRYRPSIHWKSLAAVTFFIGAVFVTPFYIWEHTNVAQVNFDIESLLSIGYVCIFPSVLAYIFYNRGVELIGPNRAGAYLHMGPFFGSFMAIIFLGEKIELFHIIGLSLILTGVIMTSKKQKGSS